MKLMWILVLAIAVGLIYNWYKKKPGDKKKKFKVLSSDDYVPRSENSNDKDEEQYTVQSNVDSEPRVVNANIEEEEQFSGNYWISVEPIKRKVAVSLRIKYKTTSDAINERVFDVSSFSRGDRGYHIHGYCHKRKKNITLSSLGVIDAVAIESGELIDNINKYLEAKYTGTTEGLHNMLFDDYGWAIYVLIYLAATSGSVNKKERDMIALFVRSIPKFSSLKDSWIDKTLKGLRLPGKMEIRNWVKAAIKKGADFSIIQDTIDKLETIQKEDNKEFWTFRKYIEKQINDQKSEDKA